MFVGGIFIVLILQDIVEVVGQQQPGSASALSVGVGVVVQSVVHERFAGSSAMRLRVLIVQQVDGLSHDAQSGSLFVLPFLGQSHSVVYHFNECGFFLRLHVHPHTALLARFGPAGLQSVLDGVLHQYLHRHRRQSHAVGVEPLRHVDAETEVGSHRVALNAAVEAYELQLLAERRLLNVRVLNASVQQLHERVEVHLLAVHLRHDLGGESIADEVRRDSVAHGLHAQFGNAVAHLGLAQLSLSVLQHGDDDEQHDDERGEQQQGHGPSE